MNAAPEREGARAQLTELEARYAALRQAARSLGAEPADMLEAAFSELEGAIDLIKEAEAAGSGAAPAGGADNAERTLLRAAFQDAPVPLFLLARDGTVQRVNRAGGKLIGAKPGYATGRPFTTFVSLPSRAAVNSQLTAAGRTGKQRRIRCDLLAADGVVPCELLIGRVEVRGEAAPLMVAVRDGDRARRADTTPDEPAETASERLGAVQAVTRRLDLVTAVARLLLENEAFSESRTLQRCARLIAGQLNALAIVDVERRHRLRRQFVLGPDDLGLAEVTSAVAAVDPEPDSIPWMVQDSGRPVLIAHAADAGALGAGPDGQPLLVRLNATSVLAVPLSDGENR
jgi:PAS domain S-box-containing protein